ncbi:hypothetical protein LJD47_30920, partial [Escherichia coli]|nr:hypothetical protein [Escherichia coli]
MTLSVEIGRDVAAESATEQPDGKGAKPSAKRTARIASAATIAGLVLVWIVAAHFKLVSPVFLPAPSAVLWKFYSVATNG